jgi:hypothetical protein
MRNNARRSMDLAEGIAKLVVEAALPGSEMVFRDEQSRGEYDFDLHYRDGMPTAAVEVTESADQQHREISAEIRKKNNGWAVIEAEKCKTDWIITLLKRAKDERIRNFGKKVDACLSLLEQAGRKRFDFLEAATSRRRRNAGIEKSPVDPVTECVEKICYDLRIENGFAVDVDERVPPKIFIKHPTRHGSGRASVAIEAGEREAWKDDNRKKLDAAQKEERHLFVYIDRMNGLPWAALTDFEPPSVLPNIPEEITHIWLAGYSGQAGKLVIWRATAKEPWASHRVDVPSRRPRL